MAEYIERETLLKRLCDMCENEYCKAQKTKRGTDYSECVDFDIIRSAPAVDAVPVVRCFECKHGWTHPCGYVLCHRDGRSSYEMVFDLDSFCSFGKRKEGAE